MNNDLKKNTDINDTYIDDTYQAELDNENFYYDQYLNIVPKNRDITIKERIILVEWLIKVMDEFYLPQQILHITINYLDRYLSYVPIDHTMLRLVGITSLFIACKMYKKKSIELGDVVHICDNIYSTESILGMEEDIIKKLEYRLIVTTIIDFLERYLYIVGINDDKIIRLSHYLADITLFFDWPKKYLPSKIAMSCILLSLYACQNMDNLEKLKNYTNYSIPSLAPIIMEINYSNKKINKKK